MTRNGTRRRAIGFGAASALAFLVSCAGSAPAGFSLTLPGGTVALSVVEAGHDSRNAVPLVPWEGDLRTSLEQSAALTAGSAGASPRFPGARYALSAPVSVQAGSALQVEARTSSRALVYELWSADSGGTVVQGWLCPPVAAGAAADRPMVYELPLPSGYVLTAFRLSPLEPVALEVTKAAIVTASHSYAIGDATGPRSAFTRLASDQGRWLLSWGTEALPDPVKGQLLTIRYAAPPQESEDAAVASVRLAGPGGTRSFHVRVRSGVRSVVLPLEAIGFRPGSMEILAGASGLSVLSVAWETMPASDAALGFQPAFQADLWAVLNLPPTAWRERELEWFSWNLVPAVKIIDFADLTVQDSYLKRLIFFAEKKGYRGTLQPDEVIAGKHGWNANDFRAETLAAFFDKAAREGFSLNPSETRLAAMAQAWGLIRAEGGGYEPGTGSLVTIARGGGMTAATRSALLQHECLHAIYFESQEFRRISTDAELSMAAPARSFIRDYLSFYQYDPADDYLMNNELMAYLLQQSLRNLPGLVTGTMVANYAKVHPLEEAAFRTRAQEALPGLLATARILSDGLWRIASVSPSRLACLVPVD